MSVNSEMVFAKNAQINYLKSNMFSDVGVSSSTGSRNVSNSTDCSDGYLSNKLENHSDDKLVIYRRRWGVLFAVCFLNISNGVLFINFFPTATLVAEYFGTTIGKVNWYSIIFMIVSIPGSFFGPYCTHRFGLRKVIWVGCFFNAAGATVRMISTSGVISSPDIQYTIGLCGQVFAAVGQNFFLYLHTKVSQSWFPEHQRGIATTCLAIADPVGIVIAELTVPHIINESSDVPLNDKIWFGLAMLTVVATVVFVRRSKPPTPPSRSAGATKIQRPPYSAQLRSALTIPAFLWLFLSLGGGVAFTISIQTVTQEILCPLGYTEEFGGLLNAVMLVCGFVGSALAGILLDRTGMYTEITMYLFGVAAIVGIILFEFLMKPGKEVAILIMAGLFGIFGVSIFPVGLELAVEATYPVEETITTALIFLSGQIQAAVIVIIIPILSYDKVDSSLSNCDTTSAPQDYTTSLMVVMAFLVFICCTSLLFFKTDYKRQKAELAMKEEVKIREKHSGNVIFQ